MSNVIPITILQEPLEIELNALLRTAVSVIRLGKAMNKKCPIQYRQTLTAIREMFDEELKEIEKEAA
ncbi:hypothetical protein [Dyadobacter bucti]|uniref:hypothetical protein n=1 Tax=Dyadobacter bucti TaxID=2572203 RepID=UPI0011094531|nr:hypothetical protein [Dyadobacter bucti]